MFARNVCFSRSEWQDPRLMYPFPGAIRRFRMHGARILPSRPLFRVEGPEITHGAKMLPALSGLSRRSAGRGPANWPNGLCALRPGPGPPAACAGLYHPARPAPSPASRQPAWFRSGLHHASRALDAHRSYPHRPSQSGGMASRRHPRPPPAPPPAPLLRQPRPTPTPRPSPPLLTLPPSSLLSHSAIRVPRRRKRTELCSQLNAGIKMGPPNGDPIK